MNESNTRSAVVMDYETTYATDPNSKIGIKLPIVTVTGLNAEQPLSQNPTMGCSNRNPQEPVYGDAGGSATITFLLDCTSIMYWLKNVFDDPTTVDNGDGTYTHTYKIGNEIPSFLLEKGFYTKDLYYKFNGLVASGFSFSVAPGDAGITITMNVESGGYKAYSITPYDAAPNDVSRPDDWVFKPDVTFKEGGVADNDITEVTVNYANNAILSWGLNGAGKATDFTVGMPEISGTITSMLNDNTLLAKADDRTESSMEITLTDSVSSPNHSVVISFPELKYGPSNPDIDGPGATMFSMPYIAYYGDGTDESAIVVTVTNNVPSSTQTTTSSTSSSSTSSSTTTIP